MGKSVLLVGIEPTTIDFAKLAGGQFSDMTAAKIQAGLDNDIGTLNRLGYDAALCLASTHDLPETTEARLGEKRYDCVLIGAGVRSLPDNFLLFERLINVVHAQAPQAKICFNTKPDDSTEAVQRWL